MMNRKTLGLVLPVAAGLALTGLALMPLPGVAQTANQQALAIRNSPIQPLIQQLQLDREKVALGQKLFWFFLQLVIPLKLLQLVINLRLI